MTNIRVTILILCFMSAFATTGRCLDDPKQTPANTVTVHIDPVKPQVFSHKTSFYINRIVDRSGNPQPLLAYAHRGGVFFDREPSDMVRQALEESFKSGDMLAPDAASADTTLDVYIFEFGLAQGSGFEFFAKVELNVVLRNNSGAKSQTLTALGASIQNQAIRKANIQKNVTVNVEEALQDAVRSLVRGVKFRDAVVALQSPASSTPEQPSAATVERSTTTPHPPAAEALTKAEVLRLLKNDTTSLQLAALVKERGITFAPTSNDLADIRKAGGQDELIHALETSKPH